ncbi:hypothetical protein [Carnobacterium maltaromaticum]|uniref:hypothetical protein n=1 Tax=Carnobacterium maltaromaticum TaxID=2751 RepID=UPI000B357B43|nr:hypothetical protein [Carnobacterium maltaromaticum]MBC9787166.1 hypothetical protein [Carnobacterium maltaromaticum]
MVDIVKVSNNGVEVYPRTHASAVLGLSSVQGPKGDTGATGPQGPKGDTGAAGQNATTTAVATTTVNGLMAAADKVKLNNLPVITFEKVGTV